ncbi:MAG: hypothetical protein V1837_04960 [Candidatus Woesearchaeota archaeon]
MLCQNHVQPEVFAKEKAAVIYKEVVDERGRFIRPEEFQWLLAYFRDRYDPRRLVLALTYCVGLRIHDATRIRINNFNEDFTYMRMQQCKAHVVKKNGLTRVTSKTKNHPLPEWLSADIRGYAQYRLAVGHYLKVGCDSKRLFPSVEKRQFYCLFDKLRKRYGDEQPWLREIWYIEKRYAADGRLIVTIPKFRVAPHMGRAMHACAARAVCDGDLSSARLITGHNEMKDIQRYTRYSEVDAKKQELVDRFMTPLNQVQPIPLTKDQRTLETFGFPKFRFMENPSTKEGKNIISHN